MIMSGEERTQPPIIGILAQETSKAMKSELMKQGRNYDSYIAASYVKAVESSGARVVPIFLDQSEQYYRSILNSVNGVVLPGGNTWFYERDDVTPRNDGYPRAAEIIYREVKKINERMSKYGETYPLLGICLGYELLLFVDVGKKEYRGECETIQTALPVEFKEELITEEWEGCPVELFKKPVSYFSHRFYVKEEIFDDDLLKNEWKVVATTNDKQRNVKYVSIIESKKYPILGLQFHPEKNAYEWKKRFPIPHTKEAVQASRYFFDWLVRQSRNNNNKFEKAEEEVQSLINNFSSTFTPKNFSFDEIYFFPQDNNSTGMKID